jgi:hypothetical protein
MALAYTVIDAIKLPVIRQGIEAVEMSWILEDNSNMRHILESVGSESYKRYRIYQKDI